MPRTASILEPPDRAPSNRLPHGFQGINAKAGTLATGLSRLCPFGTVSAYVLPATLMEGSRWGTYISVEPFHLGRYVDEQVFRFNERKGTDSDRFNTALRGITVRKLTYKEWIGNAAIASAA